MLLDRCESCGEVIERARLVRMRRKYLQPAGSNLMTYSEYGTAGTGWTIVNPGFDTTTAYRSCGVDPDTRYISNNSTGHGTTHGGIMVFVVSAGGNPAPYFYLTGGVVHAADFYYRQSLVIGKYEVDAYAGPDVHHDPLSVTLGVYQGGDFTATSSAFSVPSSKQIYYCNTGKAAAQTAYWAFSVARPAHDAQYFWFEHYQVESSTSTAFSGPPKVFIPTTGAAVTYATDTVKTTVAKVCPECRERYIEDWEYRGIPRLEPEEAIPFEGV